MSKLKTFLSIFPLALVFGCDNQNQQVAAPASCPPACVITIEEDPGANPPFKFVPDVLTVPEGQGPVIIVLQLDSEDFRFLPFHGSDFKTVPSDGEITVAQRGNAKKRLLLLNLNGITQDYKYSVSIKEENGPTTYVLDPQIKNGGGGNNFKRRQ